MHIQQDRNRIGRLLETVKIKPGAVVSSIVGKSSLAILRRLADGADQPEALARLALQSLKRKIPELILALEGRPDAHFRWMLSRMLKKLEWLDPELACIVPRRPCALHQDATQISVSLMGLSREPFAGALCVAGTKSRPTCRVPSGGELRHICSQFRHQNPRRGHVDAGYRIQAAQ